MLNNRDTRVFVSELSVKSLYLEILTFLEKGCPTKPYATTPIGIMGNMVHGR